MKMIPPEVTHGTASDAEKSVFRLLKQSDLGPGARCFHSLNISEHDYKLVGELDFVVLVSRGLLVLEVKGGGVACHDGVWHFTDRFGRERRSSEGPFQQARSAMFSLRRRLREDLHPAVTAGLVFGYGIVTPDADLPDRAAEWVPAMVLDGPKVSGHSDLAQPLSELLDYWIEKTSAGTAVSEANLDRISEFLRPDFDRVPALRFRADQIFTSMERLTEEQYEKLDLVETTERLMCEGGAGTGKTFLAAEVARRDAAQGRRVLVTCVSSALACFIQQRVTEPNIVVASLDEIAEPRPFDVLIVDEGQDLLTFEALERLDRLVDGGLEKGRWRFFFDANNQSSLYNEADDDALAYLRSLSTASGRLRSNCRNTTEIVLQTRLLTAADLGNPCAGHGPPVEYVYFADAAEQANLLEAHLRWLRDEDVAPGEITILTCGEPETFRQTLRSKWRSRVRILDARVAREWPVPETTVANVAEFKGLENQFICLVDVPSVGKTERDRNFVYVAMSRARASLWIALDQRLRPDVELAAIANLDAVMEGAARD